jgi:putative tributyrin esterase
MNFVRHKFLKSVLLLLFVVCSAFAAEAQKIKPQTGKTPTAAVNAAQIADFQLNSKLMAREMPYKIIYPNDYQSAKAQRFPVIYLLHGLTGHFDNWASKTKILEYARKYNFLIVMPEGGDGWYTDSISENNDRFESYITEELIPEIDKNFRTFADRKNRFIAGLSMGGYGSIKFGLKRPEMFVLVGSFSGALEAASWTDKNTAEWLSKSIMKVYGAADSPTRAENDIYKIVRELPPEKIKDLPFIYASCGTEDFFYKNSRSFADLLQERKIPHEYRELPGRHGWDFWDAQVQEFLRLSEKFLK